MADDDAPKTRSPRRETERTQEHPRDREGERNRDDRPRRRSRSPRREEDRNRPPGERNFDRRDDRDSRRDRERSDDRPRRGGGGGGGFKWKQKRPENGAERDEAGGKRLERGYRKRSRSPRRDRERPYENRSGRSGGSGNSVEDKFGVADKFGPSTSKDTISTTTNTDEPPKRPAAVASAAPAGEAMIIVHVNDRLGTKAAIPCLASDPIRLFKAQVAARIGRQPHEILLKRQGERPFKDQLTLEDYGVSNGVQIDLEIDTGE